jgi:hypothetical protein
MARLLWLVLPTLFLLHSARGQLPEQQGRLNKSEIASLAQVTRADHSTIFFRAFTNSATVHGYISNGEVHSIVLEQGTQADRYHFEVESAVSHDGSYIAYSFCAGNSGRCKIVVRDLRTGKERSLAAIEGRPRLLSWSWNDTEIAYAEFDIGASQGLGADLFAVAVADGSKRGLGHLRIDFLWEPLAIEWLHDRPELVLNVSICRPDRRRGGCTVDWQTLLFSHGESRVLAAGVFASVSPVDNQFAYIADDKVFVTDVDGLSRRTLTSVPASPWSKIVWSPRGDRLLFSTVLDEGGNTNVYLVDVTTGHRQRILKRTLLRITDWRQQTTEVSTVLCKWSGGNGKRIVGTFTRAAAMNVHL